MELIKPETASKQIMIPETGFGMDNILDQDVSIPKLLLMQQMSKFVTDDTVKARAGEIRESYEGRLMGTKEKPVQIIPFYTTNTWTMRREVNGKWEFDSIENRTATDAKREYEAVGSDGITRRNYRTLNIFCIVRGANLSIPYMISMSSFSFKLAAQKFINKGKELSASKEAYAHRVFNLSSQMVENDKGKWYAFAIESARDENDREMRSTQEELAAAYNHYKTLKSVIDNNRVDVSDLTGDTTTESTESTDSKESQEF